MAEILQPGKVNQDLELTADPEEEPKHHCAIVGVYDPDGDPVETAHTLLCHMNHRGQEGSMIVTQATDGSFNKRGGPGWVSQAYTKDDLIQLKSNNPSCATGQNRYSTSGGLDVFQPFVHGFGGFDERHVMAVDQNLWELLRQYRLSLAHNGTVTNAMELLAMLPENIRPLAENDTGAVFLNVALAPGDTWEEKIRVVASKCEGATNLVINADNKIYAYRDPWGFRPLSIGKLPAHGEGTKQGYVVASENAAFQANDIEFVRDVHPGEGVVIDENGVRTFFVDERTNVVELAQCIFEIVYFAAPDAVIFGKHVSTIRREIGKFLARKDTERGFLPDIIVPVQHSGMTFAEGYAAEMIYQIVANPDKFGFDPEDRETIATKASDLQTRTGLVANIYANGRTFIAPSDRAKINTTKHRADQIVNGLKVVRIDDSIVRGHTATVGNLLLRKAGATEVHDRYGYPYVRNPCFMGVDFADKQELILNREGEQGVQSKIGADSIDIITPRELLEIVVGPERMAEIDDPDDHVIYRRGGFCGACIIADPQYPTDVTGVYAKTEVLHG